VKRRPRRPGGIAPGLLVAAPSLVDPSFVRTVVLLVEHGGEGSLGIVVNRPADVRFEEVLDSLGLEPDATPALAPFPLLLGGPVSPETGWLLFDPGEASASDLADAVLLGDGIALSASRALLERMLRSGGAPQRPRVLAMGYAGWSGGQLDDELERGVWLPATLRADLVFRVPPEERWAAALKAEGIDPGRITGKVRTGGTAH
jgi:putative transcriptional regulator